MVSRLEIMEVQEEISMAVILRGLLNHFPVELIQKDLFLAVGTVVGKLAVPMVIAGAEVVITVTPARIILSQLTDIDIFCVLT